MLPNLPLQNVYRILMYRKQTKNTQIKNKLEGKSSGKQVIVNSVRKKLLTYTVRFYQHRFKEHRNIVKLPFNYKKLCFSVFLRCACFSI
jgi:hypothetical protein